MTTATVDTQKVEEFAGKMVGILNSSGLALLASVGHQTGLFDTMADLPPSTSERIAAAAGLNERYVREWLGGMTVGGIVAYDPTTKTYTLPPEHAASLTRAAGPGNMAFFTQYLALAGEVESELIECFRNGGGVPYSSYSRFTELQREETGAIYDASLIDGVLPLVDGLVDRLERGIEVADVGCGSGHAINLMARTFPRSRFTGHDFSREGIAAARAEAADWGLANTTFVQQDVAAIDATARFDFITAFDAIHDQAQPGVVLANIARALKPGATFLMADIAASSNLEENLEHPMAPLLYWASTFHCMTVSLAQGGDGLGTMWGEQVARKMLGEAGFREVNISQLEGDFLNAYYVCRK